MGGAVSTFGLGAPDSLPASLSQANSRRPGIDSFLQLCRASAAGQAITLYIALPFPVLPTA